MFNPAPAPVAPTPGFSPQKGMNDPSTQWGWGDPMSQFFQGSGMQLPGAAPINMQAVPPSTPLTQTPEPDIIMEMLKSMMGVV